MSNFNNGKTVKRTFWGAAAFYILIAFEFFYMASPFAAYFYAVYQPALNFFNESPVLAGLVSYFLPHFSQTSSALINLHNVFGAILAFFGFLGFCVGACQVYYHKLAKKGAVTGGIYNYIRHPQYASFIICSFGLLLLWPRYIVLIMFITMLFAYYFLAKVEEKECEAKFGQSYLDYKNKTGMFFPVKFNPTKRLPKPELKLNKFLLGLGLYLLALAFSFSVALWLNNLTFNNLYAFYTDNSATISVNKIESAKLERIINLVYANEEVKASLNKKITGLEPKFLNYILSGQWYVPEVPMNDTGTRIRHSSPSNYDRNSYKIIFTQAKIRSNADAKGIAIIENIQKREPILEVWVDLAEGKVVKILDMPAQIVYDQIPVAVY